MTDDWWAATGSAENPEPPRTTVTLATEESVRRGGGAPRVLAALLGTALLVGGAVFALAQTGGAGPDSAEEAVAELLDAASNEDVLGLLAALDPGERESLRGPLEDLFDQLERLEVVDGSFQLDGIAGVDVSFDDVTYRTEPVREGLARVYLTGGTVTGGFEADELPIGDFVSDTLDRFGVDISGASERETQPIVAPDGDPQFLVARLGDDGWRVSISYTAAEYARADAGSPALDPNTAVEAIGADSPTAAVEGLLMAAAGFDLRGALGRLAPSEFGAAQEYAFLFIDEAEAAIADGSRDVDVTVEDIDLRADADGDLASVFLEGLSFTVRFDGNTVDVAFDDECVTVSGDTAALELEELGFGHGPICAEDLEQLSVSGFGLLALGLGPDRAAPEFPPLEAPRFAVTTIRHGGEWYVAPVRSGLDNAVAGLRAIDRGHLDAFVDAVEHMWSGFESSFSEVGAVIEGVDEPTWIGGVDADVHLAAPRPDGFGLLDGPDLFRLTAFTREISTGDEQAACLMERLLSSDPSLVLELLDAHEYDLEPSIEAQEALTDAAGTCPG